MKTADIKAHVNYSTCDGELVVPVEPIHAHYQMVRDTTSGGYSVIDLSEDKGTPENPWGACHKTQPKGRHRVGNPGIWMKKYAVDRNGAPVGESKDVILRPQDVAGKWTDYLALYGHVVSAKADEVTAAELVRSTKEAIEADTREAGWEVGVRHEKKYIGAGEDRRNQYALWVQVTGPVGDERYPFEDKYHEFAHRAALKIAAAMREVHAEMWVEAGGTPLPEE